MGTRKEKVQKLSKLIYENCVASSLQRFQETGSVTPTTSLRHKATRKALEFASDLAQDNTRWFTVPLVKDALQMMITSHPAAAQVPKTPGFSTEAWLQQQAKVLAKLLSRARRSTAKLNLADCPSPSQCEGEGDGAMPKAPSPDEMETQAYDPDPAEDSSQPWW